MSESNEQLDKSIVSIGESARTWTPQSDSAFPLNPDSLDQRDRAETEQELQIRKQELVSLVQSGEGTEDILKEIDAINIDMRALRVDRPAPKDAGHIPPAE